MKTLSGTRIGSGQHAPATAANTMHALVHHGPGNWAWEEKSRPVVVDAGDAVVRMTTSTICGTDLHILKGDVPSVAEGRVLGHEGVGVDEACRDLSDHVAFGHRSADGRVAPPRRGRTSPVRSGTGFAHLTATRPEGWRKAHAH